MKRRINFTLMILFVVMAISACDTTGSGAGSSANGSAFIVTSDFETGSFATIDTSTREASVNIGSIHGDAVARAYQGLVYIVNRFGADNIQALDPANGYATLRQFSTGAGSNPHDIAFASASKAYITRYETAKIWIVNPQTGAKTGTIDLTAYSDSDGTPEASQMIIEGGKLFVAIQKLDRNTALWNPTGDSRVLVIDMATDKIIASIKLPFQNPAGPFTRMPGGKIAIACIGYYQTQDGGVAIIDTGALTASAASVTEAKLGGDINSVIMISETTGFAVISDTSFTTILKRFDFSTNSASTLYQSAGFNLFGMAVNGTELWISDNTATSPGIRIFDINSGSQTTTNPINVGLPPSMILFL